MTLGRRLLPPLLGLVGALALLAATRGLGEVAREGQLGPAFWPRVVLIGLAAVCAIRAAAAARRVVPASVGAASIADTPLDRRRLAGAIGLVLLYVATPPLVGFPLATAVFIAAFMRLAGARSAAGIVTAAALGTIVLLYVFIKLVYLPLPKGDGGFETATVALYRALGIF